jgi:hypothetical protein
MTVSTDDLTPREGKVLRYVCTYTPGSYVEGRQERVEPSMCVVATPWSNLPRTLLQARSTLEKLRKLKLVKKEAGGYAPTAAGQAVVKSANDQGIWQSKTD